ncbi:MAG: Hpt domain-containing protein, partial [Hymenobacter sp.]
TPEAPDPTSAIVDPEVLKQLLQLGGEEFTAELYGEFIEETTALMAQINEHWQATELDKLHPLLHQLKGTAGTLGLTKLATQALALEKAIKKQQTQVIDSGLPELNKLFATFIDNYPGLLTLG